MCVGGGGGGGAFIRKTVDTSQMGRCQISGYKVSSRGLAEVVQYAV